MGVHASPSTPPPARRRAGWRRGVAGTAAVALILALCTLPVKKYISLGVFATQVLIGGLRAPDDGREGRLLAHVVTHAPYGNVSAALAAADAYQSTAEFFMSVGVEKGEVLAAALANATIPITSMLELGTYCGYGALTMLRAAPPGASLTTVEYIPRNAAVARAMFAHAGVSDRVDVRVGELGDHVASFGGARGPGPFDAVFIDHAKDAYVPDLRLLLDAGLLSPGAVIIADNIKVPGAPEYRAFASAHPALDTRFVESTLEWLGEVGATDIVAVSTFRPAA